MIVLQDSYQRKFKNLRVSLLETCNFQCVYCTMGSEDGLDFDHRPQQNASFFIDRISKLHQHLALETIRLTGGEPLLYRELPQLVEGLTKKGFDNIKLTTNGFLLKKQAKALKKAGLKSINVSLDAIDEAVFFRMSGRRKVDLVLEGISAALDCGLEVKLNAVMMNGYNEGQLIPLLHYAFSKGIIIRFLEVMAMGHLYEKSDAYIFKQADILEEIGKHHTLGRLIRTKSATANYWQTSEGHQFGIIANESAPFCSDCNRLRMDASGNLYGCLSVNQALFFDANGDENQMQETLQKAMAQKQAHKFTGSALSMLKIGG